MKWILCFAFLLALPTRAEETITFEEGFERTIRDRLLVLGMKEESLTTVIMQLRKVAERYDSMDGETQAHVRSWAVVHVPGMIRQGLFTQPATNFLRYKVILKGALSDLSNNEFIEFAIPEIFQTCDRALAS